MTAFHFSCDGIYEYENIRIQCYHKTAHGEEDFAASFANSCNGAFASMGLELDLDGLKGLSEAAFIQPGPASLHSL